MYDMRSRLLLLAIFAIITIVFFVKSSSKRRFIHFSSPVPSWCIGVRDITKNGSFMRYTEGGEYEGKCVKEGCLYSIELESGYTYHITTKDYKTSNPRTEFYLSINPDSNYIIIPENILDNKEKIYVCCDKKAMHVIIEQIKNKDSIQKNELINTKNYLMKFSHIQTKSLINLKDEVLLIFENNNNKIIDNQLVPFLYVKIE